MLKIFDLVARSREPLDILLQGESGTGKELIAKAIHLHSARRDRTVDPSTQDPCRRTARIQFVRHVKERSPAPSLPKKAC